MTIEKTLHDGMYINTFLTDKVFTLLAKSLGLVLFASSTSDLLVIRHLLQHLLHVCIITEMKLVREARDSILGELGWAAAHRTFHHLAISLRWARKLFQAILAECMQAWEGLGIDEVLEANGAVQLFLNYFKDIRHSGDLLSHDG